MRGLSLRNNQPTIAINGKWCEQGWVDRSRWVEWRGRTIQEVWSAKGWRPLRQYRVQP